MFKMPVEHKYVYVQFSSSSIICPEAKKLCINSCYDFLMSEQPGWFIDEVYLKVTFILKLQHKIHQLC